MIDIIRQEEDTQVDNYLLALEDISKSIKVGNKTKFSGSCGFNIDKIEIFVDGFKIGEANIAPGVGPVAWSTWSLEYSFTNGGHRSFLLTAKSKGAVVLNRFHTFNVESETVVKPDVKPGTKFPVTIVESKVRHVTQGPMELEGLCVHFSASRQVDDPSSIIAYGNNTDHAPFGYWVLAANGIAYRTHPTNRWAYHTGTYHHRTYLGLEILSPGLLTERGNKLFAWYDFKNEVPKDKARWFEGNEKQIKGWYWPYTKEQEAGLVGLIQFLKDTEPKFKLENVKGHDEICFEAGYPGAKNDPGGSLSMSMPAFREYLKTVIV